MQMIIDRNDLTIPYYCVEKVGLDVPFIFSTCRNCFEAPLQARPFTLQCL